LVRKPVVQDRSNPFLEQLRQEFQDSSPLSSARTSLYAASAQRKYAVGTIPTPRLDRLLQFIFHIFASESMGHYRIYLRLQAGFHDSMTGGPDFFESSIPPDCIIPPPENTDRVVNRMVTGIHQSNLAGTSPSLQRNERNQGVRTAGQFPVVPARTRTLFGSSPPCAAAARSTAPVSETPLITGPRIKKAIATRKPRPFKVKSQSGGFSCKTPAESAVRFLRPEQ